MDEIVGEVLSIIKHTYNNFPHIYFNAVSRYIYFSFVAYILESEQKSKMAVDERKARNR